MLNRSKSGFTLIEVLVSFTIFSLALITLFKSVSDSGRHLKTSEDKAIALQLAQSKLASVGQNIPLQVGKFEGRFENEFAWNVEITPYQSNTTVNEANVIQAFWILVTVKGANQSNTFVSLETLRIDKTQ